MPPGRDNIPLNHPRRIARIYHLSERDLAHESVEVRQLCRDFRDRLWSSETRAKIERGEMVEELRAALERRNRDASVLRKLHEDRLAPSINIELIQAEDAADALLSPNIAYQPPEGEARRLAVDAGSVAFQTTPENPTR